MLFIRLFWRKRCYKVLSSYKFSILRYNVVLQVQHFQTGKMMQILYLSNDLIIKKYFSIPVNILI